MDGASQEGEQVKGGETKLESKVTETTLLIPSVPEPDFGELLSGGCRSIDLTLHNAGQEAVEVSKVSTSCSCFSVQLAKRIVGPGETVTATVKIDLSEDPKYAGRLRLDARGDAKGRNVPAFLLDARVSVKPSS